MPSKAYASLRDFLTNRMRMSHVYQPIMLRLMLTHGGKATIREIARSFLNEDRSQLEYYERITKEMPGKVLTRHRIVERDGNTYRLAGPYADLSETERKELAALCEASASSPWRKRSAPKSTARSSSASTKRSISTMPCRPRTRPTL
jgi:hypothetical protein